ncbi:MAG: MotA/TolQ/ExbB proton channel family protein [Candidatus Hydrothermota bacterium]|nr:MAG: MotA/TolQ/ExbB proton channel family protein [Candidatus Hydrothermae bacterium]
MTMVLGSSLFQIFKSSWVMDLLLLVSIMALAFVIERYVFWLRRRKSGGKLFKRIKNLIRSGRKEEALELLRGRKDPVSNLIRVALENDDLDEDGMNELLESTVLDERRAMERYLSALGSIGTIAPLLGLLGTVVGLIKAFHNIAVTGSGGPAVVASGIAEALLTTAFGLIIAIPVVVFYNYFANKALDTVNEMEAMKSKLLYLLVGSHHRASDEAK